MYMEYGSINQVYHPATKQTECPGLIPKNNTFKSGWQYRRELQSRPLEQMPQTHDETKDKIIYTDLYNEPQHNQSDLKANYIDTLRSTNVSQPPRALNNF